MNQRLPDLKKKLSKKSKNIKDVYVNDEGVVVIEYNYIEPKYKPKQKTGLFTSQSNIKQHF